MLLSEKREVASRHASRQKTLLSSLISAIPEVYQPIFGHPETGLDSSRPCVDRLAELSNVVHLLTTELGRPIRILDLGCAQGFFSLSLARMGAVVHGIDYLAENVAICQFLADENESLAATFSIGLIQDVIKGLDSDQYDLVLALSVFHHLIYEVGFERVHSQIGILADRARAAIFELAEATEPQYWAASLPATSKALLSHFAFCHEIRQFDTHLSSISRPMYFASNFFWCFDQAVGQFERWETDSHVFARGTHEGTRRYFFGDQEIIKHFYFGSARRDEVNHQEYLREVRLLSGPPVGFHVPNLIRSGHNESEAWIVRDRLDGVLLVDAIQAGTSYDENQLLKDILRQLAALESQHLYHEDVRTWNVIMGPKSEVHLIDYGAIVDTPRDCVWPHNIFLAFFIFIYEVTEKITSDPVPLRAAAISPHRLREPYRSWIQRFCSYALDDWSFNLMEKLYISPDGPVGDQAFFVNAPWIKAVESALDAQVEAFRGISSRQLALESSERQGEQAILAQAGYIEKVANLQAECDRLALELRKHHDVLEARLESTTRESKATIEAQRLEHDAAIRNLRLEADTALATERTRHRIELDSLMREQDAADYTRARVGDFQRRAEAADADRRALRTALADVRRAHAQLVVQYRALRETAAQLDYRLRATLMSHSWRLMGAARAASRIVRHRPGAGSAAADHAIPRLENFPLDPLPVAAQEAFQDAPSGMTRSSAALLRRLQARGPIGPAT